MKILSYNTYMGQSESVCNQLINTVGFLLDMDALIAFGDRYIQEVLKKLDIQDFGPDVIFLTEIYIVDLDTVTNFLSSLGYKSIYYNRGIPTSNIKLYTVMASKVTSTCIEFQDNVGKLVWGGGVLMVDEYAVVCIHFALRNKEQEEIRETLLRTLHKHVHDGKKVILAGDFNQNRDDIEKKLSQKGLIAYGNSETSHKVLGSDLYTNDLDHVLLVTDTTHIPEDIPSNIYKRYNSDHAAIYSEID